MSSKRKKDPHFSLNSPIIIVSQEPTPLSKQSVNPSEQTIFVPRKPTKSSRNSVLYTPPDALMFPLFSAIQRKAWVRARHLCYELILCDPSRKNYHDLYEQINQIIHLVNLRTRPAPPPPVIPSRKTTAGTRDTDKGNMSRFDTLSYMS